MKAFFLRIGLKGWFVGATALSGALAGLYGSIYAPEIKGAFPFTWECCRIVSEAFIFWALFVAFGIGFATTFWAQNESTGTALADLKMLSAKALNQTTQLENIIRTLPPDGFLDRF